MNCKKLNLVCLQLDLARQKESLEYVQAYFQNAKAWGYDTIILYLENTVRTPSTPFFAADDTYSMEEMAEIASYADSLGLRVIPAFENLAHLEKFFEYPQFRDLSECENDKEQGRGFSPKSYSTCGCVSNERLYEVMDTYIAEVSSLFKSEYIHMGLDEPFDFAVCERCKQRIERGESKADMFFQHVMHAYSLAKSLGKRMMMWDDFFEYADIVERLPRDIIFCNWNYSYVSVEPGGHWTNRIKKDWFYLYEKLGFDYMFCVYAHRASSVYNLQSFTQYAQKYHPIGAICTAWERRDCFYLSAYPFMAYAGRLWSGEPCAKEQVTALYARLLENEELAELVLSLNIPAFGGHTGVGKVSENGYFLRRSQLDAFEYVLKRMRSYSLNDVALEIYQYIHEYVLYLKLCVLGEEIFNQIESGESQKSELLKDLEEIESGYREIEGALRTLWEKYRAGVASAGDGLNKKFLGKKRLLDGVRESILSNEPSGVLYFDAMLHDGYCTVNAELKVKFADELEETVVYDGAIKPSCTGFEVGGCYGFRMRIKERPVEYALLSVYGEGALYPLNLRYRAAGKLYVASGVEAVCGNVENEEKLLLNDTQFAVMGTNDGVAHFNQLSLSKQRHTVKVTFTLL